MSETKHTPGEIYFYELRDGLNDGLGYIRTDADTLEICHHGDSRRSADENRANAARFIRTWNCHDDLVAALRHPLLNELLGLIEDGTDHAAWAAAQAWMDTRDAALSRATTPTP